MTLFNLKIKSHVIKNEVFKRPSANTLHIMDVYGKLYTQHDIKEGQNSINLAGFPTGILIFAVGDQRFKVLKE